jgi:hypothetical protein
MKKLSLKNLKVVKISDQEKATINGGSGLTTSASCDNSIYCTGPYNHYCHG